MRSPMDRRSFLKFMGTSAATASASSVLANIPEAVPKIELLEPKKIITEIDAPTVFDKITRLGIDVRNNLHAHDTISGKIYLFVGRYEGSIEAECYLSDINGDNLTPGSMADNCQSAFDIGARVMFDLSPIRNRVYIVESYHIDAQVGSFVTATIVAHEIHSDGSIVTR